MNNVEEKNIIEMQCWLDTHELPFVIIDKSYRIVGVNQAFEKTYGVERDQMIGQLCYQQTHHSGHPCRELGSECPYEQVYHTHQPHTCLHTHYDSKGQMRWVRIKVYPLTTAEGEVYLGESIEDVAVQEVEQSSGNVQMVGKSPVFLKAVEQLELASHPNAPVLLLGETGTGKELAAAFIHRHSQRREHPFLAVDCTVLTETLFESEVFGHERGAYTGSVGVKKGLFELADGGTLFLDEIGELPSSTQAKLLRVLETGEFRRVGGHKILKADVRIICATNRHLWDAVKTGQFREDLYYRVACFCIRMPALRERLEDISVLTEAILARIGQTTGVGYRISSEAVAFLQQYHYPGNVRELRNILQIATAYSQKGEIGIEQLSRVMHVKEQIKVMMQPPKTRDKPVTAFRTASSPFLEHVEFPLVAEDKGQADDTAPLGPSTSGDNEPATIHAIEAHYISELLKKHGGHRYKVAKTMGISERTLYRKLKRYGLT
jgi:two-component system, NtrC family, response regulator AtoC